MMWSKRDSDNLASIAQSLEKIADREMERNLYPELNLPETDQPFLRRIKMAMKNKKEEIKVHETPLIEEAVMEEDIKTIQRMQNRVMQAEKDGNTPFFVEALLDENELELL